MVSHEEMVNLVVPIQPLNHTAAPQTGGFEMVDG